MNTMRNRIKLLAVAFFMTVSLVSCVTTVQPDPNRYGVGTDVITKERPIDGPAGAGKSSIAKELARLKETHVIYAQEQAGVQLVKDKAALDLKNNQLFKDRGCADYGTSSLT